MRIHELLWKLTEAGWVLRIAYDDGGGFQVDTLEGF
jgi:hypothetical protein